jgi:hypothetical protein
VFPLLVVILGSLIAPAGPVAAPPTVAAITTQLKARTRTSTRRCVRGSRRSALQRMAARHGAVRFVVLNELPRGCDERSGSGAGDPLGPRPPGDRRGLARRQIFAASSSEPQARVDEALRRARRQTNKRAVPLLERFAVLLTAPPPAARPEGRDEDDGRPIWQWLVAAGAVALLALGALRLRQRSREARARRRGGSLSTAKDFHGARLDALSARHAGLVREVADRPTDAALAEHFELARGKITALRRSLPTLHAPRELRTCSGELDEVEWHLEAAQALVAGSAVPERPLRDRPGLCFFTHEHGLAHHAIEVDRPNGVTATIRVCDANFEALSRGEPPFVSQVHVGSRLLPWPAAPTWYGAAGWTPADLPGLEVDGREIWGRDVPQRTDVKSSTPPAVVGAARTWCRRDRDECRPGPPADRTGSAGDRRRGPEAPMAPPADSPDAAAAEPPAAAQIWEELDQSPPAGLNREAAARAIGPLEDGEPPAADEAGGLRRGEDTVAFDPFAEPFDEPDAGTTEQRTRRSDG